MLLLLFILSAWPPVQQIANMQLMVITVFLLYVSNTYTYRIPVDNVVTKTCTHLPLTDLIYFTNNEIQIKLVSLTVDKGLSETTCWICRKYGPVLTATLYTAMVRGTSQKTFSVDQISKYRQSVETDLLTMFWRAGFMNTTIKDKLWKERTKSDLATGNAIAGILCPMSI